MCDRITGSTGPEQCVLASRERERLVLFLYRAIKRTCQPGRSPWYTFLSVRIPGSRSRMSRLPLEKMTRAELGVVLLLAAINFNHILDFVIVMPLGDMMMKEVPLTTGQFSDVVSAYGIAAALFGLFR